jgi:protein BCP1
MKGNSNGLNFNLWLGNEKSFFMSSGDKLPNPNSSHSDSDDDEVQEIDVEFEFSTPSEVDFHGIKTLLKQTFSTDIERINDSFVADYIVKTAIGNVVKTEGNTDPFALCCLLDSKEICSKPIIELLLEKSKSKEFQEIVSDHCGILINDRLINMPPQLAAPLFEMLYQENNIKYRHLIYISKIYTEVESTVSDDDEEAEKPKKKKPKVQKQVFFFQAEDEFLQEFAILKFDYLLPKQQSSDSRRVFQEAGIEPSRRVFVIPFEKMKDVVEKLKQVMV